VCGPRKTWLMAEAEGGGGKEASPYSRLGKRGGPGDRGKFGGRKKGEKTLSYQRKRWQACLETQHRVWDSRSLTATMEGKEKKKFWKCPREENPLCGLFGRQTAGRSLQRKKGEDLFAMGGKRGGGNRKAIRPPKCPRRHFRPEAAFNAGEGARFCKERGNTDPAGKKKKGCVALRRRPMAMNGGRAGTGGSEKRGKENVFRAGESRRGGDQAGG